MFRIQKSSILLFTMISISGCGGGDSDSITDTLPNTVQTNYQVYRVTPSLSEGVYLYITNPDSQSVLTVPNSFGIPKDQVSSITQTLFSSLGTNNIFDYQDINGNTIAGSPLSISTRQGTVSVFLYEYSLGFRSVYLASGEISHVAHQVVYLLKSEEQERVMVCDSNDAIVSNEVAQGEVSYLLLEVGGGRLDKHLCIYDQFDRLIDSVELSNIDNSVEESVVYLHKGTSNLYSMTVLK
ncbi:hypothetical protein JKP31_23275 [Vibrio vulnificus]|uniref:hypothetical protein n=1 Tax=Vibrio vulnificus TaxID=672 RepID=UPI001CDD3736|nr:hypothetical protein [Vibrio vulnificus]MCA3904150.1 hypothetical protein [Vibrio vulnificus]